MNPSSNSFASVKFPVVDLHLHTTASDGLLTPSQLIIKVADTSLRVVAITDHDSTDGIDQAVDAATRFPQLSVVPGIELSSHTDRSEIHLLGLYIDHNNAEFQKKLRNFRDDRVEAIRQSVEKLNEFGIKISWSRVKELAEGTIGRPHIARAMVEAGYIENPQQAFEKYLGDDGIARVERKRLSTISAIELVHQQGGAAVIAHPRTVAALEKDLPILTDAGLDGIEVFAERYSENERHRYLDLASRYNLLPCGGSDYHAFGTKDELEPGTINVPGPSMLVIEEMLLRIGDRAS